MTYKDQLENRKNARKLAQHQNRQEQPAQLASRKKDLLAHLEENIRGLGVTIEIMSKPAPSVLTTTRHRRS